MAASCANTAHPPGSPPQLNTCHDLPPTMKKDSKVFSLPMTQTQPPECPTNCCHYQTQNPASSHCFQSKETKHQHNSTLNMPSNGFGAIRSPFFSPGVPNTAIPAPSSSSPPSSWLRGSEQLRLTINQQDPIKTLTESKWTNQLYQWSNQHPLKHHLLRHHNHVPPLPDTNSHCTRQQATSISTTLEHQTNTSSID
jgi:hypothetical protein